MYLVPHASWIEKTERLRIVCFTRRRLAIRSALVPTTQQACVAGLLGILVAWFRIAFVRRMGLIKDAMLVQIAFGFCGIRLTRLRLALKRPGEI